MSHCAECGSGIRATGAYLTVTPHPGGPFDDVGMSAPKSFCNIFCLHLWTGDENARLVSIRSR